MTKIKQLEHDIKALNRRELSLLRDWFQTYLADEWDKQIEADVKAGKLDRLARKAFADHEAGRSKPL